MCGFESEIILSFSPDFAIINRIMDKMNWTFDHLSGNKTKDKCTMDKG